MAEFDPSAFDDLSDTLKGLADATEEAKAEVSQAFETFKTELPESLQGNFTEITKDADGHWTVTGPDGAEVDLQEYEENKAIGDMDAAYRPIFGDALDTDAGKEFIDKVQTVWDNSPNGKYAAEMKANIDFGNSAGFEPGDTRDDFNNKMDANGWDAKTTNANFLDAKQQITTAIETEAGPVPDENATPEEKATWSQKASAVMGRMAETLKSGVQWLADMIKDNFLKLVVLALIILAAEDLYDFIKGVESALSGCFSSTSDGRKCKVRALTCSDNDLSPSQSMIASAGECDACTDITCQDVMNDSNSPGYWIPLKLTDQCACNPNSTSVPCSKDSNLCYPGSYNVDATSVYNTCGGQNAGNCPVTSTDPYTCKYSGVAEKFSASSSVPACNNASGCVPRCVGCANNWGQDCSTWCTGTIMRTASGQSLGCNKCDFGCAVGATFKKFFSLPGSWLNDIWKWLKWILIGILILVVGSFIIKQILHWLENRKNSQESSKPSSESSSGPHSIDLNINVHSSPQ